MGARFGSAPALSRRPPDRRFRTGPPRCRTGCDRLLWAGLALTQRHGIGCRPEVEDERPKRKLKTCPIGCFHIDITEIRSGEGQSHLFVAIAKARKTLSSGVTGRPKIWRPRNASEIPSRRCHIALIDQEIGMPLVRMTMAHGTQLANRPQDRRAMAQFPGSGREGTRVKHQTHIQPIAFAAKTQGFSSASQIEGLNLSVEDAEVGRPHHATKAAPQCPSAQPCSPVATPDD
ncbi:hypothetical protein [Rhodovulum sulfidophilum]|uniref:hypothetical protein n=1 Tax=Rhodovulum sulfidophilum TaxID=35806 RepID=UPI001F3B958E|nr:hypothetical protein [Rhodovulum sulfidophilum]MCE8439321.1 hypothetical protein [Rhodovulum sulfidophilum]